jgi:hypothetical protein
MVLLAKTGGLPRAGGRCADLPDAAADADEPAVMEVDVGVAYDDVYIEVGIEPKLCAVLVFVAVAVRRCVRWRPRLTDYYGLAGARRHRNPLATPYCDGCHQCSKKSCETNHDRYLQRWDYRPIQLSP